MAGAECYAPPLSADVSLSESRVYCSPLTVHQFTFPSSCSVFTLLFLKSSFHFRLNFIDHCQLTVNRIFVMDEVKMKTIL